MVLSKTYQQQSVSNPTVEQKDPKQPLPARANTSRLPAEIIRDNALKVSGLLNTKVEGKVLDPISPRGFEREKTTSPPFY